MLLICYGISSRERSYLDYTRGPVAFYTRVFYKRTTVRYRILLATSGVRRKWSTIVCRPQEVQGLVALSTDIIMYVHLFGKISITLLSTCGRIHCIA